MESRVTAGVDSFSERLGPLSFAQLFYVALVPLHLQMKEHQAVFRGLIQTQGCHHVPRIPYGGQNGASEALAFLLAPYQLLPMASSKF